MQALWLPESICDFVDKKIRNCIWGKGDNTRSWNLVPWKDISCPKDRGGLGLRCARLNNIAMLGKLVESLLCDRGKPWVIALSQKYLANEIILDGECKAGNSYVWKGIIRAKEYLHHGFRPQLGDGAVSLWYDNWLGSGKLCFRVPFVHVSDTGLKVADLWLGSSWNFEQLYTVLPLDVKEEISSVRVPTFSAGHDVIRWAAANDGRYSVSSAYAILGDFDTIDSGPWKRVWRCKVPEKIRFFIWLLMKEGLPTNEKRFRNHLSESASCSRCGAAVESLSHLFRECPRSCLLWHHFGSILPPLDSHVPFSYWLVSLLKKQQCPLGVAVLWWGWRWRNEQCLGENKWELNHVLRRVLSDVTAWRTSLCSQHTSPSATTVSMAPFQLMVDGSWIPGCATMGGAAVLVDSARGWRSAVSASSPCGNAFLAELWAVELGLAHAWELGIRDVVCACDCEDVVRALQIHNDISTFWDREVIAKVRDMLSWDWNVSVIHVAREENNTADCLARQAARDGAPRRVWKQPPSFVYASIYLDALNN